MMWDVGVSEVMSAPTLLNAPLSSLSVEVNLDLCERDLWGISLASGYQKLKQMPLLAL
jgi:hypothetical protein